MEIVKQRDGVKVATMTLTMFRQKFDQELTKFIIDGQIKRQCS